MPRLSLVVWACLLQQARHDFDVRSPLATDRRVGVETFEGQPIDIELPSSVSGQHLVNFNLRFDASKRHRARDEESSIRAEMTLPVHLRYPDPGCERRGEDCEAYAWVEVSKPKRVLSCSLHIYLHVGAICIPFCGCHSPLAPCIVRGTRAVSIDDVLDRRPLSAVKPYVIFISVRVDPLSPRPVY